MASRERRYVASLTQRQFWFAQQLGPASPAYNVVSAFLVRGQLDKTILLECVRALGIRHDVFRTTFELSDGALAAIVWNEPAFEVEEHTLACAGESEFAVEAKRLLEAFGARPFDLSRDMPLRMAFVRGSSVELSAIGFCVHHIAFDQRSKELVAAELEADYSARLAGTRYEAAVPLTRYEAFADWQASWTNGEEGQGQAAFLRGYVEARSPSIPLLPDLRRPPVPSMRGDAVAMLLDPVLRQTIEHFGRERQVAPYVILLAAYYWTLRRYTGCGDFLVGIPLSNRRRDAFKDVVGCLVNTVPLGIDATEDESFESVVRCARRAMLVGHRNQETPAEVVVRGLAARGEITRNPLYQVGFTFEDPMQLQLPGATLEPLACETGGAQLELFLRCSHTAAGIQGKLEYDGSLFRRESVQVLVDGMLALLKQGTREPSRPMKELDLLPDGQRRLVARWNDTRRAYVLEPLSVAFERQVERTPDAIALRYQGREISYRSFNEQTNQLARLLIESGVRVGDMVPLCAPRGIEMLVGVYGIAKAGGAYVPLEPSYPPERIRSVLSDTGRRIVLTTREHAARLAEHADRVFALDDETLGLGSLPSENVGISVGLGDPAYVIFTSGSTGKPKGVVNLHAGIANRLCWMQEAFGLSSADRVLFKTPFTFDVSVWELFWALQVGATIEIAPPEVHRDPAELSRLISEAKITTMHFVPSMLDVFLSHRWGDEAPSLKRVICSGEALPRDLQDRFFARYPAVELHNLYGPTEAAVDVTHWMCQSRSELDFVPIGRAIANTQIHIVEPDLRPSLLGAPGEICIGGIQVAKGYVGNQALTDEKFVPDPFSDAGFRLYRTGDRGRFLPDGNVQYLGRMDRQVKIRGNRIELGEIESVLRALPAVREAAAAVQVAPGRGAEIVGYLVGEQRGVDELREHLGRYLPDYMVPAFFVFLAELPKTASGKLDAKALPAVDAKLLVQRPSRAPRSEIERRIMEIWSSALQRSDFGASDNFFDVGGNSLLLARVFARLREEFDPAFQFSALFQYTTIESLARFVETKGERVEGNMAVDAARARAAKTREAFSRMQRRKP